MRAFKSELERQNFYNSKIEIIPIIEIIDRMDSLKAEIIGNNFCHNLNYYPFKKLKCMPSEINCTIYIACELASQGVAAIFGPSSHYTSSKFLKFQICPLIQFK